MINAHRSLPLILLLLGLAAGWLIGPYTTTAARTTNIVVDSDLDIIDNTDGVCTLREAVTAANEDIASSTLAGECPAGTEEDIIVFDLPAETTITLGGFPLTISKTVTIIGGGADGLTIDADQRNRVLQIKPGAVVTLTGMTLMGGKNPSDIVNAAGILNEQGVLLLDDVVVSDNVLTAGNGGGIHSLDGSLTLLNSVVRDNTAAGDGGGIFSRTGTVVISNTIIAGNHADDEGGGVHINDTSAYAVTIVDSQINANTAVNEGGGVSLIRTSEALRQKIVRPIAADPALILRTTIWGNASASGGGIANNGALTVRTSTLSGNTADLGGGIFSVGLGNKLTLVSSTLYENTGGLHIENSNADVRNSIIAHDGAAGADCNKALTGSGRINLDSDGSCGATITADPRLAPLSNGIHLLYGDSPGWDAGVTAVCVDETDGRGLARPSGFGCDLGAFERNTPLQHIMLPILQR